MGRRIAVGVPDDGPYALGLDPTGGVWASLVYSGRLARVGPDDEVTVHDLDAPGSRPSRFAATPDGSLWCTRTGDHRVERLVEGTWHGVDTGAGTGPYDVTAGPDGAAWFTAIEAEAVGRIDPATEEVTLHPLPIAGMPAMITTGPDGALWCTLNRVGALARLDPASGFALTHLPDAGCGPVGIAADGDGLWFVEILAGRVGRLDLDGRLTEHDLPDRGAKPHDVVAVAGGCVASLWGASGLARVTSDGSVHALDGFEPDDHPHGLLGRGDDLWVACDSGAVLVLNPY
ncbi:virginiamycin B lyase [Actinomycetospora corticicola]|uniref:Virginiamycin B lyase n=1 Tax=Actinomycetospora corticicola TaxID=663602 RepID=A0A7Y9DW48_9PSEU|nr:virginiamycin B lyase [Actinomycetospora corticicola]NYD36633.1 virginiamycin B lyase [Actinomycetospora corticicola]